MVVSSHRRGRSITHSGDSLYPLWIFTQIMILQTIYYGITGGIISYVCYLYDTPISLDLLFSWKTLKWKEQFGWALAFSWILASVFVVLELLIVVKRSKLVPDFVLTLYLISFLVTIAFTGEFPHSILYWVVQIISVCISFFLGIWITRWNELRTTFFAGDTYQLLDRSTFASIVRSLQPNSNNQNYNDNYNDNNENENDNDNNNINNNNNNIENNSSNSTNNNNENNENENESNIDLESQLPSSSQLDSADTPLINEANDHHSHTNK